MRFFSIRPPSFNGLIRLGKQLNRPAEAVKAIETEFLRPYCIAYLDQLLCHSKTTQRIYTVSPAVNQYLRQVDFPFLADTAFGNPFPQHHIIRLKRFQGNLNELAEAVPRWLQQEVFLRSFSPNFSLRFKRKIVKNLWEIICNTVHHSESTFGISCCGQFYPECGYFEIAFYDHGVGIPYRVRKGLKDTAHFSDQRCISWALQKGATTRALSETRGLGLYYLQNFLSLNGGWLQAASHFGMYQSKAGRVLPGVQLREFFPGTMFNLRIIYDKKVYQLKGGAN